MNSLSKLINEKLRINKDIVSYASEMYEVVGITRDPNTGRKRNEEVVARFISKQDAEQYKKDWEKLYKEHYDNDIAVTPCWIDFEPTLTINELQVFDKYDEDLLIKQYPTE